MFKNGRHLEMMPYLKDVYKYQWPHITDNLVDNHNGFSPWMKMFRNAYEWCDSLAIRFID